MRAVVRIPGGLRLPRIKRDRPGTPAGLDKEQLSELPSSGGDVKVTVINFSPDNVETRTIDDIERFVAGHRPEWCKVSWINVDGASDLVSIKALAGKYETPPAGGRRPAASATAAQGRRLR